MEVVVVVVVVVVVEGRVSVSVCGQGGGARFQQLATSRMPKCNTSGRWNAMLTVRITVLFFGLLSLWLWLMWHVLIAT